MQKKTNLVLISLLSSLLAGCAGFFDKDNTPPPSPLVNFTAEIKTHPIWSANTGNGVGNEYIKLTPAISDNLIFTANTNGTVTATDKISGKTVWAKNTKTFISGGPGTGDHLVVVGTHEGTLLALRQIDGQLLWTTKASSEILAAPAISEGVVLVKTIDGKLSAFAEQDGHPLWHFQQTEPALILRGASVPIIDRSIAIAGFANGNLAKLTLAGGNLLWQHSIATPEGSFAIQRMIDIDADPIIFANRIYAATYQGHIAALDLASGQEYWNHDLSSYSGITADSNKVYVSDAKSHIWAFDANTGAVDWRQTQLEARNTTAPVSMGNYLVVADAEGYLHWLSKADGHFVARVKVGGGGILANPIINNNVLYVVTINGQLAAYTLG